MRTNRHLGEKLGKRTFSCKKALALAEEFPIIRTHWHGTAGQLLR